MEKGGKSLEKDADNDIQSRILKADNSNLTTLSGVVISYSEGMSDALEKIPNLQHLDCIIVEPQYLPTHGDWFPKLDVLNKLESLIATYRCYEYHPMLIRQPNKYHFPSSLKELRLNGFPLRPESLSAIAALPELEIMEFISCDFVEDKWDASEDIYQSLKTLTLQLVKLSEWQVGCETFPKLEELILVHCYELTEIPCAFTDIHTLKSIRVAYSNSDLGDSAIDIKKDVAAYTGEDRLQVHISYAYE